MREYITRGAPGIEEVGAYMTEVEKVGGQMISITTEGREKYPADLEPHTTYRIWAMIPEGSHDQVNGIFDDIMGD